MQTSRHHKCQAVSLLSRPTTHTKWWWDHLDLEATQVQQASPVNVERLVHLGVKEFRAAMAFRDHQETSSSYRSDQKEQKALLEQQLKQDNC